MTPRLGVRDRRDEHQLRIEGPGECDENGLEQLQYSTRMLVLLVTFIDL